MTAPPYAQTITLITRVASGTDGDGNTTWTEQTRTATGVFNTGASSEAVSSSGDVVTAQPFVRLYGVDASTVAATDAVEVSGVRFEVDGLPSTGTNPWTGWSPNIRVNLRRITG